MNGNDNRVNNDTETGRQTPNGMNSNIGNFTTQNLNIESTAELTVLQLNAQHKKVTHDLLMNKISQANNKAQVLLIQEPYVTSQGLMPSIPIGWDTIFLGNNAKAAIIVNKQCTSFPYNQFCTETVVPVLINNTVFVSV